MCRCPSVLALLVLSALTLLATCSGCEDSGAGKGGESRSAGLSAYLNDGDSETHHDRDQDDESVARDDHDADSSHEYTKIGENSFYHDSDDYQEGPLSTGRRATALERPVAVLIGRYLDAARSMDVATACSLLLRRVARSLPSEFGNSYGPSYTRGATNCESVLMRVFRHYRSELHALWVVTEVRISSSSTVAMLGSRRAPASTMALGHEGASWRLESLIPLTLP